MNTAALAPDHRTPTIPTYISRRQLMGITGLSDTTIWRMVRDGNLPAPVRLSPGRVAWPESVIRKWLADRAGAHTARDPR